MHTQCVNRTECLKITNFINSQIREVDDLKVLVRQLTRSEDKGQQCFKRGVF
jgi:hypothetical protein